MTAFSAVGEVLGTLLFFGFVILPPAVAISLLAHFLFSLPMRRRDRARFFLDLIETVLNSGRSVEHAIISAAESRDRVMGVGFFLVAAHIEAGSNFGDALEKVPGFLPPNISAILRAGEKLGDLKKVLPACRENLRNSSDSVHSTVQYMVGLLLVFSPIAVFMIVLISTFVVPRFKDVAAGMNIQLWPLTQFVFAAVPKIILFEVFLFCALILAALIYVGGPRFVHRFQFRAVPLVDWIAWRVPWKQKRLQRTFSAMLAVLLDGGVSETEAVRLAGNSTANEICRRRARRTVAAIEQGTKLDEAVRAFDDSGEFHWRLTNATHAGSGFLNALRGWHEALDTKAFQQEEVAAQTVTSGLVILNGIVVALIATGMFGILIAILNGELSQ